MNTMTKTNTRVTVENGWAVRNLDDGSQVRARLIPDPYHPEPERGAGMWNEGVSIVEMGRHFYDRDQPDSVLGIFTNRFSYGPDWEDEPETVARFLRIFRGVQHVQHERRGGRDILVIAEGIEAGADPAAIAQGTWDEWLAWADGDVYSVESQTRTLTDAMCSDPSDPDDGWEDLEHVGGYYGDDGATAGLAEFLSVDESDLPWPHDVTVTSY